MSSLDQQTESAPAESAPAQPFAPDAGERKTLAEYAATQPLGRMPWRLAVGVATEVARALEKAHGEGVTHGGIDPDRVYEARHGGWALAGPGEPWHAADPAYFRAPEVLRGAAAGPAADLYALGALLYWMIAGRPAFHDTPPAQLEQRMTGGKPDPVFWVVSGLPKPVSAVIGRLMAVAPDARCPSAAGALRDLANCTESAPVRVVAAPVRKKSGLKAGAVAAVLVVAAGAFAVSRLWGDAEDATAGVETAVRAQAVAVTDTLAAAGVTVEARESRAETAARAAAQAAVDAIDERAAALGALAPETVAGWSEITDAYEALLQVHSPDIGCIQQAYLRCRLIRTDIARMQATGAPPAEVLAGADDVLERLGAEVAARGADVLPAGLDEAALRIPDVGGSSDDLADALGESWDATHGLVERLHEGGRSAEALRVAALWIARARPLAAKQADARRALERAEQWVRQVAVEDIAVAASDLRSDVKLLRGAYAATRLVDDGLPLPADASDDGAGLRFGAALRALDGARPLLRTAALAQRAKLRQRRMYSALEAWTAVFASAPGSLLEDGRAISGIQDRETAYVDGAAVPTPAGLPVRASAEPGSARSVIPWKSVPASVIARELVLPFAAQGGEAHQAGAAWLLVALERPEEAEIAVELGSGIAPAAAADLRAEIAALRRLETLGPTGELQNAKRTTTLLATDSGLARRPDLATSWELLLPGRELSSLLGER